MPLDVVDEPSGNSHHESLHESHHDSPVQEQSNHDSPAPVKDQTPPVIEENSNDPNAPVDAPVDAPADPAAPVNDNQYDD